MSDSEILIERLRKSNRRWKIAALAACLGLFLATFTVFIVSSRRIMQAEHARREAMAAHARAETQLRRLP